MHKDYQFHCPKTGNNSYLVSFEGIEGSGKSTQVERFIELLKSNHQNVSYYREPGGTTFGEKLREAILTSEHKLDPIAEAMLFASARAQLLFQNVLPDLQKDNQVVILDRYLDSSLAYQGHARGLGVDTVLGLHQNGILTNVPHLTFYLKIDYQTSVERQKARGNEKDYFEKEKKEFYEKLIQGYDNAASIFPNRIKIIDATCDIDNVTSQINTIWKESLK
jgi:dTMP kinase